LPLAYLGAAGSAELPWQVLWLKAFSGLQFLLLSFHHCRPWAAHFPEHKDAPEVNIVLAVGDSRIPAEAKYTQRVGPDVSGVAVV